MVPEPGLECSARPVVDFADAPANEGESLLPSSDISSTTSASINTNGSSPQPRSSKFSRCYIQPFLQCFLRHVPSKSFFPQRFSHRTDHGSWRLGPGDGQKRLAGPSRASCAEETTSIPVHTTFSVQRNQTEALAEQFHASASHHFRFGLWLASSPTPSSRLRTSGSHVGCLRRAKPAKRKCPFCFGPATLFGEVTTNSTPMYARVYRFPGIVMFCD